MYFITVYISIWTHYYSAKLKVSICLLYISKYSLLALYGRIEAIPWYRTLPFHHDSWMRNLILALFVARAHILWRHHAVNHPNGVRLFCPRWMINIDSKNTRQFILFCHINCTTLLLRKQDTCSQMELLERRTISVNALLDIVELEDNFWAGEISIWCIPQKCIFRRFFGAAGLSMLK